MIYVSTKMQINLKKVDLKLEVEDSNAKSILKEANNSDDDVWEPSARKEKNHGPSNKPSRHSGNKKVHFQVAECWFYS